MIKYLKYMLVAAIVMIAAIGCQEDPEDAFSKAPTAPELVNNGSILMTQNTMTESIKWTWTAARFLQGEVTYSLYVKYGEEEAVQVGTSTKELSLSVPKTDFHTLLERISAIPENSSFNVNFYVVASDGVSSYESKEQSVKIYSYGDFVSAVVTPVVTEVVLDMNAPSEPLELLAWEPARLVYGESIAYNVSVSGAEGKSVEVATGLVGTSCSMTVDEWNEAFIEAGAVEGGASDVKFVVTAISASCPEGIPSSEVIIQVDTYKATFPSRLMFAGKPVPQSSIVKGLFECFVNVEAAGTYKLVDTETNVEYGSDNAQVSTDANGNQIINGNLGGNGALNLEAGLYRVSVSLKFNTLLIVKINSMAIIGNATPGGWDAETPMVYDALTNTFTLIANMTQDGEFKYRANNNWGYAIDGDGNFADGTPNIKFTQASGEYKITLDVTKHPYVAKIVSTAFPSEEYIYVPGNHQQWSPATAPALWSAELNGVYTGFSMLDGGFKFTLQRAWGEGGQGEYNYSHFTNYSEGLTDGGGGNISMSTPGFYYIVADVMTGTLTATQTSSWGIVGDATGSWDVDQPLTWDAAKGCWSGTVTLINGAIKFRANGGWDINVGGTLDNLVFNSSDNINVTAGTYLVELYLQRTDNEKMYCTMTQQ